MIWKTHSSCRDIDRYMLSKGTMASEMGILGSFVSCKNVKEVEIIVLLLPLCYTVREIRAASAMTRLEAHFFERSQQERDKKTIRAANSILKPRKIRACKPRFQNVNPERGRKPVEKPAILAATRANFRT